MPSCYLLTVCDGSALDRDTNSFSLFSLVEQLVVEAGGGLQLEIHTYWELEPDELHQEFELRILLEDRQGQEILPTMPFKLVSSARRWRMRALGIKVPGESGEYHVRAQWRRGTDGPWTSEHLRWPLMLTVEAPRPSTAATPSNDEAE